MGVVPCDRSLNWVTAVAGVPEKNKPARGEGLVVVLPAAKKRKPGFGSQAADWESFGFESKGQQPSEAKPLTAKALLWKPGDSKTAAFFRDSDSISSFVKFLMTMLKVHKRGECHSRREPRILRSKRPLNGYYCTTVL